MTSVNACIGSSYHVKPIFPEQIINDDWEKEAALLIIPGGADIPYTRSLNGIGNQKIRDFVENGGSFLGICAGCYYAGAFVDFAKETALEVQGMRELSFFPGIVRGPFLAPYDYQSEQGARAAKIIWKSTLEFQENDSFYVYYNGGGYFVEAALTNNTTVLATYSSEEEGEAAIIECRVGLGKAILSGVHFEYDFHLLDASDHYLQQIIPILESGNLSRLQLMKHLLDLLCD
jgi:glutamine amidotransferase-like uncharacterized protein